MKKKTVVYILLFILLTILSLGNLENLCRIYSGLGPDNQTLLLWKYTASMGMLPFRDIFYPYGLLSYYSGQYLIFAAIYFLIAPVLFFGIYLTLQKIFKVKSIAFVTFIIFFIFIFTITGFETFTRYGTITVIALLFSYIFYFKKSRSKKIVLALGALSGVFFSLIIDIGFYSVIIFITLSLCDKLIKSQFKKLINQFLSSFKEIIFYLSGFAVGLIPFILYLLYTQTFLDFIHFLVSLREIALFAKTPFFHSIYTVDNFSTLGMLMIIIIFLGFKFFFGDKKATIVTYFQIALALTLLLLEQKSVIRSIDAQLSFIGLLLLFTLIYELQASLRKYKISSLTLFIYLINLGIFILFIIDLRPPDKFIYQYPTPARINTAINVFKNKSCVSDNINNITTKNKKIIEIKNKLISMQDFNGKVLTFPGEPIFYVILNQKPPYYPTIYEATPIDAQQKLIKYIENQDINYILYNPKILSIHDEVPDTVRGRLLYEYIRTNFVIKSKVKEHVIFIHKSNSDNINANDKL